MKIAQMLALAMLLGSIPFSYIAVYLRNPGVARDSGGTLANIRDAFGVPGLAIVIALNVAKGFVPVYLANRAVDSVVIALLVGAVAILSHCFPYWRMFRPSGWGGSVAMGALLGLLFSLLGVRL